MQLSFYLSLSFCSLLVHRSSCSFSLSGSSFEKLDTKLSSSARHSRTSSKSRSNKKVKDSRESLGIGPGSFKPPSPSLHASNTQKIKKLRIPKAPSRFSNAITIPEEPPRPGSPFCIDDPAFSPEAWELVGTAVASAVSGFAGGYLHSLKAASAASEGAKKFRDSMQSLKACYEGVKALTEKVWESVGNILDKKEESKISLAWDPTNARSLAQQVVSLGQTVDDTLKECTTLWTSLEIPPSGTEKKETFEPKAKEGTFEVEIGGESHSLREIARKLLDGAQTADEKFTDAQNAFRSWKERDYFHFGWHTGSIFSLTQISLPEIPRVFEGFVGTFVSFAINKFPVQSSHHSDLAEAREEARENLDACLGILNPEGALGQVFSVVRGLQGLRKKLQETAETDMSGLGLSSVTSLLSFFPDLEGPLEALSGGGRGDLGGAMEGCRDLEAQLPSGTLGRIFCVFDVLENPEEFSQKASEHFQAIPKFDGSSRTDFIRKHCVDSEGKWIGKDRDSRLPNECNLAFAKVARFDETIHAFAESWNKADMRQLGATVAETVFVNIF
uniref:Uncharacterized protein n=1 Tax=Chromera velia CCMP2878 TaxID=1169474 RepID=A0A0G4GL70_9ALVE|eukprot:Cvel_4856.t1-p1 / transcript=Cvel_4856.t1 / gene=Cvel_4856 / organism=Chromera_velia_CCMP2878 / gene_product=hypothetical protein / transcript_product=hypothetical protein / location=Cvel_scaffold219:29880-31755(+) / protein_length=557 / sequence_SO=supercontig / SO=protein_coding / is_pseudo=false